jgi:hypothetical protein
VQFALIKQAQLADNREKALVRPDIFLRGETDMDRPEKLAGSLENGSIQT